MDKIMSKERKSPNKKLESKLKNGCTQFPCQQSIGNKECSR